ncbi:FAD-binding and (Fe-S)-binding domain-containing protein [Streptomonospora litoralis]|uniref:Anaerobic glycerol-3-phosphate dehydrogenase subunit C n=1 Tax=Streptomonospora litoralis TaxID=2498135 RepID=A0A4P6Q6J6_9ACTN|nr:FAD-binding and (Fe-S)-binding domain-containing protein [Streptomonospora litoralis]QBI54427.1 Anaerobic glycerol-3-phosphate dehydrogenase subunit C [Streptomonospora litoralis]
MTAHTTAAARGSAAESVDAEALRRDLVDRVDGEVRFDDGTRSIYATDASNYRQIPVGAVIPHNLEAGVEAVAVCREHDAPLLSRGGGTSLAGQCCNTAVVIDWSKYCNRVLDVDLEAGTATVEPGIVLDTLNARTRAEGGVIFGPQPSTHGRCTLGGMIGNDSCGSTAQAYGKTSANIHRLEILTYDGCRMWVGPTGDEEYARIQAEGGRPAEIHRELRELAERHGPAIRRRFPDIPRRVSGYSLDALLPENGCDLARALVGSEGTLATVLRAEVRLSHEPPARTMVLCGFRDIFAAADAVPGIVEFEPMALEGIDDKLVGFERREQLNRQALRSLPEGAGWLMVQFGGDTGEESRRRAEEFRDALSGSEDAPVVQIYDDPGHAAAMWSVREAGLGATARVPAEPDTWPGWEDSAVPPERFGDYLRDLHALMEEFGYARRSAMYGHFGHGCLHTRIPFELTTADGVADYRSFAERAADLAARYGGSFSGEHGDGQSRAELWPRMFGSELMPAFTELKRIFDPGDRMNPGKLVRPDGAAPQRLDEHLRLGTDYRPEHPDTFFAYPGDDGDFARATLRCVGVGACRHDSGGVMCPSYRVTGEEAHSTRGRARMLNDMLRGDVVEGWRSPEVDDALDLCLACKGCKSDCPVNVDMATYKAEFLAHHHRGRVRPAAHYSMGWLPLWARLASVAPEGANAFSAAAGLVPRAKRLGGVAADRPIPAFAPVRLRDAFRRRSRRRGGSGGDSTGRGEVILWPDTFTDNFQPEVGAAAVRVLEDAGFAVRMPRRTLCCGLTWISTGQLKTARRVIQRTVAALREDIRAGVPVVGLEPSCTAVFRSDAPEMFPHDEDVRRLSEQTFTLAELLNERAPDWEPPRMERAAMAQPHCHQHAIMGFSADKSLLERTGADTRVLDAGCCGLAGNFGFEDGHYAVSMACAEDGLLPAVRDADPSAVVLADGFSCRTQIEHADVGREAVHLAQALDMALRRGAPDRRPEQGAARTTERRRAPAYDADEIRAEAVRAGQSGSFATGSGSSGTGV